MSLALTLENALSGLNVNQRNLQVTGNNVANVNTEGYTRKIVETSNRVLAAQGAGVEIVQIEGVVNEYLLRDLRSETTTLGEIQTTAEYRNRIMELFGTLAGDNALGNAVTRFSEGVEVVANTPSNAANRLDAVNAADRLAREMNAFADQVQDLRTQADREISDAVTEINQFLSEIGELNVKIANAKITGLPTSDLNDQRDVALTGLSEFMSIQYFERTTGEVTVLSSQGFTLVESQAGSLGYSQTSIITADQRYPDSISGVFINPTGTESAGDVRDITNTVRTGKLKALIDLRDTVLPDVADQLDVLGARLRDEMNAIHNDGVGYPGQQVLTGSIGMPQDGTTALTMTGTVRIGLADPNTGAVSTIDVNLATVAPATMTGLVNQINTQSGAAGAPFPAALASISATGQLVLNGAGSNVVIDEQTSAISIGSTTRGFSHFFGMNNLFETSPELENYDTDVVASNTTTTGAGTLTIQFDTGGASGTFNAAYGAGASLTDVVTAINAAAGASGVTASVQTVTGGARIRIEGPDGQNMLITDSGALSAALNLRPGVFKSAENMAVRTDIVQNPDRMSRGEIQQDGGGNFYISSDDDTNARRLATAFSTQEVFATVGGQPAVTDTLAGFANQLLSFHATSTNEANNILDYQDTLRRNLNDKNASFSGVNLDEELSNMVVFQNAYNASARLVRTTQEMFETLTNLV